MKFKFLGTLTILLCVFKSGLNAQDISNKPSKNLTSTPAFYIGGTLGLNNIGGGIGLRSDIKISNKVMLGGAIGVSSWGGKYSVAAAYITKSNWNPMIGISKAVGLDSVKLTDVEVVNLNNSDKYKGNVIIKCKPTVLLNLCVEKQWLTKRKGHRFYIDLGYSFSLSGTGSELYSSITPGVGLAKSTKDTFNVLTPYGLILGAGFSFRVF